MGGGIGRGMLAEGGGIGRGMLAEGGGTRDSESKET